MESIQQCPKDGCDYSGNEHGLKTHLAVSHEDSKYGRVNLSCDACESEFTRQQCKVKSDTVFCSRECKENYNKEERECVVCGTTRLERHDNERELPYKCSSECLQEWLTVDAICSNCGKTYVGNRHQISQYENNYCSDDCLYDSQRVKNSETAQHKRWADRVKSSADYTCKDCGESYDVMCAHHNPPRSELSVEEQLNPDNGVCLCYECQAHRHEGGQREALLGWWEWYQSNE